MKNEHDILGYEQTRVAFAKSGLSRRVLQQIYDDYVNRMDEMKACQQKLEAYIKDTLDAKYQVVYGRVKQPRHLIEKIIRKSGIENSAKYRGIDVSNYRDIVRDLVGVRILTLSKEEWEGVFDWILSAFSGVGGRRMVEKPVAYTRYGDRDIFKNKISKERTNIGYRAQHYIVEFDLHYCEIQVRTLAEEAYAEFDHRVKYPYRNDNLFLKRYTSGVSQLLDSVDEWISTCLQMDEDCWKRNGLYFEEDEYEDWRHTELTSEGEQFEHNEQFISGDKINMVDYSNAILFRKG